MHDQIAYRVVQSTKRKMTSYSYFITAPKEECVSPSSDRVTEGFTPPYALAPQLPLEPAIQATVIEGLKPSILIPSPPKVMRADNLRGQLSSPHHNGFRPGYPSNSKLLKYRPGSSRPSSARTRILLQSTLQRQSDMDWDWVCQRENCQAYGILSGLFHSTSRWLTTHSDLCTS